MILRSLICSALFLHGSDATTQPVSCFEWQKGNKELSNWGVIPTLEKTWHLTMNIRPNLEEARYTNLFHLTVGKDKYTHGDRILRVQLIKESSRLSIWSALRGPKIKWGIWPEKLELHKWTKVEVRQDLINGKYIFSIWLNEVQVFEEENTNTQTFNNGEMFVGDPQYEGAEPPVDFCNSWFKSGSSSTIPLGQASSLPELMKANNWQESIPVLFQEGGHCGQDEGHIMSPWMTISDLEAVEDLTVEAYRTEVCTPLMMDRRRRYAEYDQVSGDEKRTRRRREIDDQIREYVPFDVGFKCGNVRSWHGNYGSCPLDDYLIQFCCHPAGWFPGMTTTSTTTTSTTETTTTTTSTTTTTTATTTTTTTTPATPTRPPTIQTCDAGWTLSGGQCYQTFCDQVTTWLRAQELCNEKNANLARPDTEEINSLLSAGVWYANFRASVWIGATDAFLEGQWTDTTGKPLTYFNWNEEERDTINVGTDRNCALANFREIGKWGDFKCDNNYGNCYACQKEPNGWADWGHWEECSESCGGGNKRRIRGCNGDCIGESSETSICSTQKCPPNMDDMQKCRCSKKQVTCKHKNCNEEVEQCEQVDFEGNFRCQPLTDGVCRAYGDPHVTTFDNAKIDVYGVATYLLAAGRPENRRSWRVLMKTKPCNAVSCIDLMYFIFPAVGMTNIVMEIDLYGNVRVMTLPGSPQPFPLGTAITMGPSTMNVQVPSTVPSYTLSTMTANHVKVSTWFGVELTVKSGRAAYVKVPALYRNRCWGLCGGFNYIRDDDYKTLGGDVLEYTPSIDYIHRTDNEWTVAKSWIWDGGAKGPNPIDLTCKNTFAKQTCEELLDQPLLDECRLVVDLAPFRHACNVDYCQVETQATLDTILAMVVAECAKHLPLDSTELCESDLVPKAMVCDIPNSVYNRCAKVCSDTLSCEDILNGKQCPEIESREAMCICMDGFHYDGVTKTCTDECVDHAPECSNDETLEAAITDACGTVASLMDQTYEHCSERGSKSNQHVNRVEKYMAKCRRMITKLYPKN